MKLYLIGVRIESGMRPQPYGPFASEPERYLAAAKLLGAGVWTIGLEITEHGDVFRTWDYLAGEDEEEDESSKSADCG